MYEAEPPIGFKKKGKYNTKHGFIQPQTFWNLFSPVRQKLGLYSRGEMSLASDPPLKMQKRRAQTLSAWRHLKSHVPPSLKYPATTRTLFAPKWAPATPIVEHVVLCVKYLQWSEIWGFLGSRFPTPQQWRLKGLCLGSNVVRQLQCSWEQLGGKVPGMGPEWELMAPRHISLWEAAISYQLTQECSSSGFAYPAFPFPTGNLAEIFILSKMTLPCNLELHDSAIKI